MMSAVLVSVMGKGGGGRELPLHCAALGFTSARKRATMRPAVLLLLVGFRSMLWLRLCSAVLVVVKRPECTLLFLADQTRVRYGEHVGGMPLAASAHSVLRHKTNLSLLLLPLSPPPPVHSITLVMPLPTVLPAAPLEFAASASPDCTHKPASHAADTVSRLLVRLIVRANTDAAHACGLHACGIHTRVGFVCKDGTHQLCIRCSTSLLACCSSFRPSESAVATCSALPAGARKPAASRSKNAH